MDSDRYLSDPEVAKRFRFHVEKFVLRRSVSAVAVMNDGISLYLDNGVEVKFQVSGLDIRMVFGIAPAEQESSRVIQ